MDVDPDTTSHDFNETALFFRICPHCLRAVPGQSQERYCVNDGERLLERCPACLVCITHPYGRHCAVCGFEFTSSKLTPGPDPQD